MVVGTTLRKFDGNSYYSPSFPRGGLAAVFVVDVTHVVSSPTFDVTVEHRDEHDTSWTTLGTFTSITAVGTDTLEGTAIKQVLRFKYDFDAQDGPECGVHFVMQAPTWRPYA